jgi:hypothetical protein
VCVWSLNIRTYVADEVFESLFLFKRSQTVFLVHIQLKMTQSNPGLNPFKYEAQAALFKYPVRTAQ